MKLHFVIVAFFLTIITSLGSADTLQYPNKKDCLSWGAVVNGSKEAIFRMEGKYRGIRFVNRSLPPANQVLAGDLLTRRSSSPILVIHPQQENIGVDIELDKKQLRYLSDQSASAEITIYEYGLPPFKLETKLVLPH